MIQVWACEDCLVLHDVFICPHFVPPLSKLYLNKLKKQDLIELCKKRNIEVNKIKKIDLIKLLLEKD